MSFMQRGDLNFNSGNNDNKNDNSQNNGGANADVHSYAYYPMDLQTYAMIEILCIVVHLIAFIFIYKSNIVDPIKNIKTCIISLELIVLMGVLVSTIVMSFLHKDENIILKKRIFNIFIISTIAILMFGVIGLYMDKIYTKEKFEQFYNELETPFDKKANKKSTSVETIITESNNKNMVEKDSLLSGFANIGFKTAKQYYIDESVTLYNIFKIRKYSILGLYIIFNMALLFKIIKLEKKQKYKERLEKDDLIVYDEEQNIRF